MHQDLAAYLDAHGFITRPQLLDCGVDDRAISRLTRADVLRRIGPGLYARPDAYGRLAAERQHVLRARAIATRLGDAVFSHQSAALLHGLPVWGVDLGHVHVTRLDDGRGRRQAGVAHHVARLEDHEVVEVDGLLVVSAARAVWDLAVAESIESGLVTADAALNRAVVGEDELYDQAGRHAAWRGARHAKTTLSLTDAGAESPGETRTRYAFGVHGLPRPETQVSVHDAAGRVVARSDLGWRGIRHVVEFDGMLKYRATVDDPEGASRAVQAEKIREDRIRAAGWGVSRVVWSELDGPALGRMIRRVATDLERSRRLFVA